MLQYLQHPVVSMTSSSSLRWWHWLLDHSLHISYWLAVPDAPFHSRPICMPLYQSQSLHPEDRSSMDLWNVGILPQHYAVSQPTRSRLESSLLWKSPHSQYILYNSSYETLQYQILYETLYKKSFFEAIFHILGISHKYISGISSA
jgi:hypothetical protein